MGTLSANFRSLGKEMMLMQAVDDHGDKPSADVAFRGVAALTNILFTRLITPPYTTTSLGSTLKALLAHYPQPVSQVKKHICTRLNYFH
ncbi:hypothetical protein AFLA_013053 [Aspergillus flavus NRRL3357]|nr:hypothetical protein AFLA_013053 [Aspergillus flavus NRRL3357]